VTSSSTRIVCELCGAAVDDIDLICPRCGHDGFVAASSEVRQKNHSKDVRQAASDLSAEEGGAGLEDNGETTFDPEVSRFRTRRSDATVIVAVVMVYYALFCWAPMYLTGAPSWCLWTEPAIVLVGAWFWRRAACTRTEPGAVGSLIVILAMVGAPLFHLFAPGWTGWQWLVPVLGLIPWGCLLTLGAFFVFALWLWGRHL
jgi:hypothetical protein